MYQTLDRLNREYVTKAESPQEELGVLSAALLNSAFLKC
jgi:hypothetical protein